MTYGQDPATDLAFACEFHIRTSPSGRRQLRSGPEATDSSGETVPRVVRLLAPAHRWDRMIEAGEVESQAEIARRMKLSPSRASEIMALRWLAPEIQERLLLGRGLCGAERDLRRISAHALWSEQTAIGQEA